MPNVITVPFIDALNTGFSTMFSKAFKAIKPDWPMVAMEVPSSNKMETYGWLKSLPNFREWVGDRVVHSLDSYGYQIANRKFELTFGVSRDQIEDDNLGMFANIVPAFGEKAAQFPDTLVFAMLKNLYATRCYDGQNFFDANHPVGDGNGGTVLVSNMQAGAGLPWMLLYTKGLIKPFIYQTRRKFDLITKFDPKNSDEVFNKDEFVYGSSGRCNAGPGLWQMAFGSTAPLNTANFNAARDAMRAFKGDDGLPLNIVPNLLLYGSKLDSTARAMIKSLLVTNAAGTAGVSNPDYDLIDLMSTPWLD